VSQVDTGSLKLQQTALMTLERREGETVTLAIAVEQTAPPQPLKAPGLPPGATVTMDSFTGQGVGRSEISLGSRTPRATVATQTKTASTVIVNENRSGMTMDMSLDVKIAPGRAP
jgi:hypothetical protein